MSVSTSNLGDIFERRHAKLLGEQMNAGFAVIDVETTGLFPGSHRIAEIAVVHVEPDGTVSNRWETLVNPQRDLGPQHIHGIRAADVLQAPVFGDIAHDVMDLLAGRVLVAHNVRFDYRFVSHELGEQDWLCRSRSMTACAR